MKRIWAVLLCLAILGGLPVRAQEAPLLNLEKAARVNLQNGRTFASIESPKDVARLRRMFSSPAYQKSTSSKEWTGWEYILTWFDEEDHLLENFAVHAPTLIDYNGYFYNLTDARLDFSYFERLLLPYYITQDLHELTVAIVGERLITTDYPAESLSVKWGDREARFTDKETIRESLEKFKDVRIHRAWADGTVEPIDFYVVTWSSGESEASFWYRPKDKIFRQGGYACTLGIGEVDTDYLDALLGQDDRILPRLREKEAAYVVVDTNGCSYTIDDEWTMETLRGMIETIPSEKTQDTREDYLYKVTWYDADGQWIDEATIVDTVTIRYGNHYFHRLEGEYSPEYLDNLLKTAAK